MFFNKKGEGFAAGKTVTILVAVVVLIVIVVGLFVTWSNAESAIGNWVCKTSVFISDQKIGIGDTLGLKSVWCKTNYKMVEEKEKEKFMMEVARDMEKCWWMWGEGNLNPSPNWLKWNQNKCFTCYKPETSEKVPEITLAELKDYLQKETTKRNKDKTYWNYLRGLRGNPIVFNFPSVDLQKNEPLFKPGKFYAVTFIDNVKTSWLGKTLEGALAGGGGGAIGCSFIAPGIGTGACFVGGFVLGGVTVGTYDLIDKLFSDDRDVIMLSEFDAVKNNCNVMIE